MRPAFIALLLILRLTATAQEEERKPSPFPEKNREREAARKSKDSSPPKQRAHPAKTGSAERANLPAPDVVSTGKACFFSLKPGRAATASGADATADELVAAHATYPLGARVLVTNLANGRSVEVTVIDRLPDSRRIISVSEPAARKLGFYDAGIADVQVETVQARAVRR